MPPASPREGGKLSLRPGRGEGILGPVKKAAVLGGAFAASCLVLLAVGYLASGAPRGTLVSMVYERRGEEYLVIEAAPNDAPHAAFAQLRELAGQRAELRGYMTPMGAFGALGEFVLTEGRPTGGLEGLRAPERTVLVRLPEGRYVDSFRGVVRARGRLVPRDRDWQGRRIAAWELLAEAVLAEVPR